MSERERIVRAVIESVVVLALIAAVVFAHDVEVKVMLSTLLGGLAGSRTAARGAHSVIAGAADAADRRAHSLHVPGPPRAMMNPVGMPSVPPGYDVPISVAPASVAPGDVLSSMPPPNESPIGLEGGSLIAAGVKDAIRRKPK